MTGETVWVGSSMRGDTDDVSGLRQNADESILLLSSYSNVSTSSDRSLRRSPPGVAIDRLYKVWRQTCFLLLKKRQLVNQTSNAETFILNGVYSSVYCVIPVRCKYC